MTDTLAAAQNVFGDADVATAPVPADRGEFFAGHIRPKTGGHHIEWSFDRHEYMRAIVADESQSIVCRKGTQVGMSTFSVGTALHVAAAHGFHVGY
ncbi:MAG TPA: hypothetical protein QGH10_12085, partial [Armatimonadota bacterium]|nr:hypothetical protein [Armatimonadota bacterium]